MQHPSGGLPPPRTPPLAKMFFDLGLKKFQCLGPHLAEETERLDLEVSYQNGGLYISDRLPPGRSLPAITIKK